MHWTNERLWLHNSGNHQRGHTICEFYRATFGQIDFIYVYIYMMAMQMQIHDASIKSIIQVESVFVYTSCFIVIRFPPISFLTYYIVFFFFAILWQSSTEERQSNPKIVSYVYVYMHAIGRARIEKIMCSLVCEKYNKEKFKGNQEITIIVTVCCCNKKPLYTINMVEWYSSKNTKSKGNFGVVLRLPQCTHTQNTNRKFNT